MAKLVEWKKASRVPVMFNSEFLVPLLEEDSISIGKNTSILDFI
jgi:hypothetical protein